MRQSTQWASESLLDSWFTSSQLRVFWQITPFPDGFCILKTLDTGVPKMLKTVTLSGIILLSLCSTAMAEVVPRCRFNPGVEDPIIDSKCSVKVEGSLDSKYKGNRTFVPEKATIRWSDGVTTQIEFKSIFDVKGGVAEGAASVDGHLYRFTRSGDGRGLLFRTLDPNLNAKEISIYFDYKK
jgi:hypothetical protein